MTDHASLTDHAEETRARVAGVGGDLPPDVLAAGLQRDHEPLTDEELAALEARAALIPAWAKHFDVRRLIADLRASRERCAVLVDAIHDMERRLCPCPEHEQQRAAQ